MPRPRARLLTAALALLLTGAAREAADPATIDLIIAGGRVIDGTGAPARTAEIGVDDDRIVFVGARPAGLTAERTIDAAGLIVAPGFIDPHTHSGAAAQSADAADRMLANHLLQGVTSIVVGNDGGGGPDVGESFARLAERPAGVNIASFVGFGAIRRAVFGDVDRAPTAAELGQMQSLTARAMCDGALGLSAGLYYAPQSFAEPAEVVALAREAAMRGGLYETHLRDEGSASIGLLPAIDEAIDIARAAGLPLHIAHIKALGVDARDMAPQVIARIAAARAEGLTITADQYAWEASSTGLSSALVPRRAMDGGRDAMVARLKAADAPLRRDIAEQLRIRGGAGAVLIVSGAHRGQRLDAIAVGWGIDPVDAAIRILIAEPGARIASFNMAKDDIAAFARQPWVVASSDATDGHPRRWGSFARRWRLFVREEALMTDAEFVHRSAGLTAEILGLSHRGTLTPGAFADIAVFDPASYAEQATYDAPDRPARGVHYVLVNGRLAVEKGALTGVLAGQPLRKPRQPNWSCPE